MLVDHLATWPLLHQIGWLIGLDAVMLLLLLMLREWLSLPRPQPFVVFLIGEDAMADTLHFEVYLPPVPAGSDVVSQELSIAIDGGEPAVQSLGTDVDRALFDAPQDSQVAMSLVYIDDAGNRSEAATQTITAVDTLPPVAPGEFGAVVLVGETEDVQVPPEPPVEPPPSEEPTDPPAEPPAE